MRDIGELILLVADSLPDQGATDAFDELLRILLVYQDFSLQFDQWWELQSKPATARNTEHSSIQWVHVLRAYALAKALAIPGKLVDYGNR